jgi:acyl-CoA thioesterase FadM
VTRTPIVYTTMMPCRFSDFDMLRHMNSVRLIQMAMDARYAYFASRWKTSLEEALPKGIAIYTTKVTCNFRRSIQDFTDLKFESFVSEAVGPLLRVRFTVTAEKVGVVHADGQLEQVFVDVASQTFLDRVPESVSHFLFEDLP